MQQPCPRCGYVSEQLSDRPVRFCRQCGAPLIAESDVTAAETRNYSQPNTNEQFSNRPPGPRWDAPALDEQPPETTRFYQSPPLQPIYAAPPAPKKSRAGWWLLIAFLSLLLVGGTMAGIAAFALKSRRSYEPRSAKIESSGNDEAPDPPPVPPKPSVSGTEQTGKDELPKALQKYFYPGAEITSTVEVMGQEVVEMKTEDELNKVGEHYRKLVGNPMVKDHSKKDGSFVFQVPGSPSTMITLEVDKESNGTQITVIRSGFIPNLK